MGHEAAFRRHEHPGADSGLARHRAHGFQGRWLRHSDVARDGQCRLRGMPASALPVAAPLRCARCNPCAFKSLGFLLGMLPFSASRRSPAGRRNRNAARPELLYQGGSAIPCGARHLSFSLALFKETVCPEAFARVANYGFDVAQHWSAPELLVFAVTYAMRIYFDFSGYSDTGSMRSRPGWWKQSFSTSRAARGRDEREGTSAWPHCHSGRSAGRAEVAAVPGAEYLHGVNLPITGGVSVFGKIGRDD